MTKKDMDPLCFFRQDQSELLFAWSRDHDRQTFSPKPCPYFSFHHFPVRTRFFHVKVRCLHFDQDTAEVEYLRGEVSDSDVVQWTQRRTNVNAGGHAHVL